MRDVELANIEDPAYAQLGAGQAAEGVLTDPQLAGEDVALAYPSLGGDFGPAGALLVDGPDDGGAAALLVPPVVTVLAAAPPKPAYAMTGRSWNQTTYENLYPWKKTPPEGMDSNNRPAVPVGGSIPPQTGITIDPVDITNGVGTVTFHGPAQTNATVYLVVSRKGGPAVSLAVNVNTGMTASQIAAAIRAHLNEHADGLMAGGIGGALIVEPILSDDDVTNIVVTIS